MSLHLRVEAAAEAQENAWLTVRKRTDDKLKKSKSVAFPPYLVYAARIITGVPPGTPANWG
jgi:hypothetical protein